jgi:soluble lytic murein transglycosylase-like protein
MRVARSIVRSRCMALVVAPMLVLLLLLLSAASPTRAEYIVLRSGQRLQVTGYQLNGDTYHLQLRGATAELPASEVAGIEPEEVFYPIPHVETSKAPFRELIQAAAARYAVDPDLITSIISAESNFDPKAVSRRNARGLMQLLPQTALRLGAKNIFDPAENINAGTQYLSELLKRYNNNLALTLAAYNAGPQTVQRYRSVPPYRETQNYVQKVGRSYAQRKSSPHGATSAKNSSALPLAANPSPATSYSQP